MVIAVAAIMAILGCVIYQAARAWTFAMEGGRFRAEARGHRTDIALDDIQRFSVVEKSKKKEGKTADARAFFELVVSRTDGETSRVPLFVASPHEACFIAERVNALLVTGGRTIEGNYRGHQVRIAEDVIAKPKPLEEDEEPEEEQRAARMRRE